MGILLFFTELMLLERIHGWTYHHVEENMPWNNARSFCQKKYTDMVAIQNAEEIEYLNEHLPHAQHYYWIGIRKVDGIWTWVGTNKPLNKEAENWAAGEPNNSDDGKEDCVEMYIKRDIDTGMWNDINCDKKKRPLCYEASCIPTSCSGHGECVETIGYYMCACNDGYYGPECENVVRCRSLEIPRQRIMNCSHPIGNFSYNSTCDISCDEGFELRTTDKLECGATGEWSVPIPNCEAIKCERLEVPNQGIMACSHPHGFSSYNSTCDFSCVEGFELHGTDRLECGASGEWSAPIPNCEAVKCGSLEIPGQGFMACSNPIGDFSYNSTCDFSCAEGFELRGSDRLECGASGEWSAPIPNCEAILCGKLEKQDQIIVTCSNPIAPFSYNSICDFSCPGGFALSGSNRIKCEATGQWTASMLTCKAIPCNILEVPEQANMKCSHPAGDFTYSSTCYFSCAEGFILKGSKKLECGATGQWSAHTPTCEAVKCDVPKISRNGNMNCSHPMGNFSYNSTCNFDCVEGFSLNGSVSLQCEGSGTWSGPIPTCEDSAPRPVR
ncbi:P-selectin-like [Heptranchias perlo]|uniref:P-selectin-like n=1 Tax=Heptranchias perlo TaxID=212740 RepID=UPI00355A4FB9